MESPTHTFDCQMYVAAKGGFNLVLPREAGPRRVIRFEPVSFERLIDPEFHKLLAAFDGMKPSSPSA